MYKGQERLIQGFWWGETREIKHLEDQCVDGRIILNLIFESRMGHGLGSSGSGYGRSCEYGNEPSDSINCREFLD